MPSGFGESEALSVWEWGDFRASRDEICPCGQNRSTIRKLRLISHRLYVSPWPWRDFLARLGQVLAPMLPEIKSQA
jgi:hypothetical protein